MKPKCGPTHHHACACREWMLNCDNIECHQGRDILASIYEAMAQLPCNGVQAILCGAAQEIQALRDKKLGPEADIRR